jgi:hypothetical protein
MIRPVTHWLLISLQVAVFLSACRSHQEENASIVGTLVRDREVAQLQELLTHETVDLRCRAAKAIAWMEGPELHTAHIAATQVQGCHWKPRAEAAWRLAESGKSTAMDRVIGLLQDPEPGVRWNAARALGRHREDRGRDTLAACEQDPNPHVRGWCVWASCRLNGAGKCARPRKEPIPNSPPAP